MLWKVQHICPDISHFISNYYKNLEQLLLSYLGIPPDILLN